MGDTLLCLRQWADDLQRISEEIDDTCFFGSNLSSLVHKASEQVKQIEMAVGADGHPEDILERIRTLIEDVKMLRDLVYRIHAREG